MDNRNFDYDKSTDVRFRRMKAIVDAFEVRQEENFIEASSEWVVKTTLTVYSKGFKKESQGVGSMSTKDDKLGWCALPYASTTSLGRAISMLGILDEDLATDAERNAAAERAPERQVIKDTKELLQNAQDFVERKTQDKPEKKRIKHKYAKEQIMGLSMPDAIKLADSLSFGQYKIKCSDLPMRMSKQILFELIEAFEDGVFLEKAKDIISEAMQKNVDKGLSADSGISAYLLEKFSFSDKPDENINSIRIESMLENFLEGNRDHLSFIQCVWEPLQVEGYHDTQLVRIFEQMKKSGLIKFENVGMMFASAPVNELRKYLQEVFSQKPL